ncbi:hypothetical protein B0H67DRAFT_673739 [Lasiosphaeris hirsuta]|uniref:LamG-like jellyroll fold domain-containing protein n=1 Tax=Lasiosphaeris hirsuta TaxID=260670 RepID=A0AA39ZW23_9PEZI|nr:hypothetical protein B0H67DRAFT_673739 [Lasiosphaeris hirsuta]
MADPSRLRVIDDPNETVFTAPLKTKYKTTRLVVHGGVSVAIALRREDGKGRLAFDYVVLDPSGRDGGADDNSGKEQPSGSDTSKEILDSQGWSDSPLPLFFPKEVRAVGEEAVPNFRLTPVDTSEQKAAAGTAETQLHPWFSSTLCLTDDVPNFEVLSDGKYIYLFRQAISATAALSNKHLSATSIGLYVDGNILCDRFLLSGGILTSPLEVRYRRSGQKTLPLNERDTLGVRDINDAFFYEPTFSIRFVSTLDPGNFAVLRTPTMANDTFRWVIFAVSCLTKQILCYTCSVSPDGLFDILGQVYYSCEKGHKRIFSTTAGRCTAPLSAEESGWCGEESGWCRKLMTPVVPSSPLSERAVELGLEDIDPVLTLTGSMDLTSPTFQTGCTIEAWVQPAAAEYGLGSTSTIFGMKSGCGPSVVLDDKLCLALTDPSKPGAVLFRTEQPLSTTAWSHVAMILPNTTPRTAVLVVNGETSPAFPLPTDTAVVLQRLGSREDWRDGGFCGSMDEVRIWKHALHHGTITANKSMRATGLESLLAACWHFDEGEGRVAYDATENGNHVIFTLANPSPTDGWTVSKAPIRRGGGLTRQTLRMQKDVVIKGGITAATYYEQSSVSVSPATPGPQQGGEGTAEQKPLKRNARVLLCAIASKEGTDGLRPLILDFGLLSDGTLSDTPGVLSIPSLALTGPSGVPPKAFASLLFIDAQGIELFGGFLGFNEAQCGPEPPCVWEAATGTVTIYFRGADGTLRALPYNISRSIPVGYSAALSNFEQVLAVSKMRTAKQITLKTRQCAWTENNVAVDLAIVAKMQDNSTLTETWKGLPGDLGTFISILNGSYSAPSVPGGVLASCERVNPQGASARIQLYRITLKNPLARTLPPATCVAIATYHVQTAEVAAAGTCSFLVTQPYSVDSAEYDHKVVLKAGQGSMVFFLGYDHSNLVSCTGKGTNSFENGSSQVSLAQASLVGEFKALKGSTVRAPAESTFDTTAEAPYFSAPSHSTALELSGDITFSMFGRAATTPACSGLTFESWIKISAGNEPGSIVAAYTSEKRARSDGGDNEAQTFVLSAVQYEADGKKSYSFEGNINDQLFRVDPAQRLQENQWVHVACACKNMYSLRLGGQDHVDLGTAAELNVGDFSVLFHLQLDLVGGSEQLLLTKTASAGSSTPIQVVILQSGELRLTFWPGEDSDAKSAQGHAVDLPYALKKGEPYKIFISRKMVNVKSKTLPPRQGQLVSMRVWSADGELVAFIRPPELSKLEEPSRDSVEAKDLFGGKGAVFCGLTASTDAPLLLGGAPFTKGIQGKIGGFQIWSTAVEPPDDISKWKVASAAKSSIGSYTFGSPEGRVLLDDRGRHHGKLRGDPQWTSSPFSSDARLSVYVNGIAQVTKRVVEPGEQLQRPKGPHQLTLGNVIHGDETLRYFLRRDNFRGELDEMRIWEVARSRESICDAMCSRLTEVPPEIAVYLPFDDTMPTPGAGAAPGTHSQSLRDESVNCWHLSVVKDGEPKLVASGAPVGLDAACVTPALRNGPAPQMARTIRARPSVAEYGDLTIRPSGGMEGSLKRAYSFIDDGSGRWVLVTGFKIGTLETEWVSQVQTSPTLIGYIEGAPPIAAENFASRDDRPSSAIRFVNATRCSYSYSARREMGVEGNVTYSRGVGAKWQASAGLGVETEVSSGEIKGALKTVIDISDSSITNEVSTATSHATLDMRVETTGSWTAKDEDGKEQYEAANTGIALVESEVADVFALRLKLRGPVKPLVAYQMRPNPDIPKDRNLVSFKINPMYTKQGCLDGRRGLKADDSYPNAGKGGPPGDLSYFKPAEAYAIKDKIRRAEEQLAGEHQQYEFVKSDYSRSGKSKSALPRRNKRNICNSYVWTADGGTFQETLSTMDFVQLEVGGNSNTRMGIGGSFDLEVAVSAVLVTTNIDALLATHFNLMLTKESSSETSFELQAELPPPIDIRAQDPLTKEWVKRPGAVDTYRWMSFWLEPSVDATASFFQQVVDPLWLQQSLDPDAAVLRTLSEALKVEKQDAKTKAWRVFHRCTYVNRVPGKITSPAAAAAAAHEEPDKKGLHDYAPSWALISALEPYVRPAEDKSEVGRYAKPLVQQLYPALEMQPRLLDQVLDMLTEYLGCPATSARS